MCISVIAVKEPKRKEKNHPKCDERSFQMNVQTNSITLWVVYNVGYAQLGHYGVIAFIDAIFLFNFLESQKGIEAIGIFSFLAS